MRFGVNTFVWVSPFTTRDADMLANKVKGFGFDTLEISCEAPDKIDLSKVKSVLHDYGLNVVVCGAFGPERNLCSDNLDYVNNAKDYITWLINAAHILGSEMVIGPMYSSVGKAHIEDPIERQREWERAVIGVREMADYAATKNIKLALEPLNRFETDMINTAAQGLAFISEVDRDNVGLHLDTFHMHLEEKSSADAIRLAGDKVFHIHACENDRGVPGTGQVHWDEIAQAIKDIGYNRSVVIESFSQEVKEIASAVCIWREIAPSQDAIAQNGLIFLNELMQ
jgi:D-psicose/D-tagatose/L-ribulose 3-epimerase